MLNIKDKLIIMTSITISVLFIALGFMQSNINTLKTNDGIKSETYNETSIKTSSRVLSSKKIEWGIKRNTNHEQPDLGSSNKRIIDEAGGIAMGNKESKKIYLTFDLGYEAGYTPKILEILKNNDVKAVFFITAHFVNSQPDLVKRMIDEGHIVGNQSPHTLMEL